MINADKRLTLLVIIIIAAAAIIAASATYLIYRGGLEREGVRLQHLVQSQARLLESLAKFDRTYSSYPGGWEAGSIAQFIESHHTFARQGLSGSGEITLARRVENEIVFLLHERDTKVDHPLSVPIHSMVAEPMRAALEGRSGIMIGKDYTGGRVLAAYEPVAILNLGMVAKVDVSEVRDRLARAVAPLLLIWIATVLGATTLIVRVNEPVYRQIADSESRFRGTFDNAAVGIALVGLDGSWLRVNQRLCQIVGYSREELTRRTVPELTHPDDLAADLARFGPLSRGELDSYSIEKRYFHKDGHIIWINLTTALQRDEEGQPLYCTAIVEDISARKAAEQTLLESESRMRSVLNASEDEILLLSIDGRILAVNEAARRRLAPGIGEREPVGAALTQLLPADLAEKRLAIARQVAATGSPTHIEVQIRARCFEFWFYPVRYANQPVSEVAIYAREITQRKEAENELRRLYQAIQQSPSSIVITDLSGAILYVNPKFCEITGYSYAEAIGKTPRILKSGYTSHEEYQVLWSTITSGNIWRGEFRNRKKNGELYWEIASIGPVRNDKGKIINYVAVKEDVTERRAMEQQLRQTQKMQAIGQLTGGIAHDFNNLLTIIIGNLQLLEQKLDHHSAHHALVTDALWAATRGGELTHRLLAFARMQPLTPVVTDLNEVIRGLTDLLRRTLGSGIAVHENLSADVPEVRIDVGELERAIVNLAINARDAMPRGGTLTLQTGIGRPGAAEREDNDAERVHDYAMLAVIDTGTGIPAENLEQIFDPFFTTKEIGQGSGLGLSMVYGFVRQSGGHIRVTSAVGSGTTFKLYFPPAFTADAAEERNPRALQAIDPPTALPA